MPSFVHLAVRRLINGKKRGDSETKEPSIVSAVAGIPKAPEEKEKTNTIS